MVFIKNKKRKASEFQFFIHQFIEACIKNGITSKKEYKLNIGIQLLLQFFRCVKLIKLLASSHNKDAIIIACRGENLLEASFPYYNHEIIPMLWDVWPYTWRDLYRNLRELNCKICFVTVRQMATKIENELGIKCYWIPEGIDMSDYTKGNDLKERIIDVYELGRQHKEYHKIIKDSLNKNIIKSYKGNIYNDDGTLQSLAFSTAEELISGLPSIKVIICFPQTDTHPERAGSLETLTQRYWEAMLSRCLIIGRAPQELIDLVGYNPVIDVNWNNPMQQLYEILVNIDAYQEIVNKNYLSALKYASWDKRTLLIKNILKENNYSI